MKADKKHLTNQIENILASGICECEEVDITTEKIIKMIWPYFDYTDNRIHSAKIAMQNAIKVMDYMDELTHIDRSELEHYTNMYLNCQNELTENIYK